VCMQVIIATVGGTGPRFYISSVIQTGLVPVLPDWPQALQIRLIEMTGQHRDKFYQGEIMCPGKTIHYYVCTSYASDTCIVLYRASVH
jgi:hypothetical protein